jgi:RNA polymerase sigma factor (sigma-70 family)
VFDLQIRTEDDVFVYCDVEGDIHEAVAALSKAEGIESLRPIDEATLECRLGEPSLLVPLREVGAQIEGTVASDGVCTVVARIAPDANVRTVVNRVEQSVPSAEMEAKRRREDSSEDDQELSDALSEELAGQLTERQRETLEAAYEEGYFEWPRESTAEEVAERMDVTSPTVHNHLRKAENEVLGELLNEG